MNNPTKEQLADPAWWGKNAPEGATHWERESYTVSAGWMRNNGGEWFFFSSEGNWIKHMFSNVSAARLANMDKRPSSRQWRGHEDGLPPVGTVCVVCPHNTQWGFIRTSEHVREVMAYHGDFVWLGSDGEPTETTRIDKVDFRPIRTPEQIASEEERRAFITEICSLLAWDAGYDGSKVAAGKLYDAGYRKC